MNSTKPMTWCEEVAYIARQMVPFRRQYLAEVTKMRGEEVADKLRRSVMEYLDNRE